MILPTWMWNTILAIYFAIVAFAIVLVINTKQHWIKTTILILLNLFVPLFPIIYVIYTLVTKRLSITVK